MKARAESGYDKRKDLKDEENWHSRRARMEGRSKTSLTPNMQGRNTYGGKFNFRESSLNEKNGSSRVGSIKQLISKNNSKNSKNRNNNAFFGNELSFNFFLKEEIILLIIIMESSLLTKIRKGLRGNYRGRLSLRIN